MKDDDDDDDVEKRKERMNACNSHARVSHRDCDGKERKEKKRTVSDGSQFRTPHSIGLKREKTVS